MLTSPPDGFLDDLGGLAGPDEGRRIGVPTIDVRLNGFTRALTVSQEARRTDFRSRY